MTYSFRNDNGDIVSEFEDKADAYHWYSEQESFERLHYLLYVYNRGTGFLTAKSVGWLCEH